MRAVAILTPPALSFPCVDATAPVAPFAGATESLLDPRIGRRSGIADPAELDDPHLVAVTKVVGGPYAGGAHPDPETVRLALEAAFGEATAEVAADEYIWVYDPSTGQCKRVRVGGASFAVSPSIDPDPAAVLADERVFL